MIKLKACHPLLPGQIRRQSPKLPKDICFFGVEGCLQLYKRTRPDPWSEAVMRRNAADLRQAFGQ